jgi:hypothetical protein
MPAHSKSPSLADKDNFDQARSGSVEDRLIASGLVSKKKMQNMANSVSLSFKPTLVSHNSKKQSTENANNMLQNFIS